MKLRKAKITRYDKDGETEILYSGIGIGMLSIMIESKIDSLLEFIRIAQKGERQFHIQKRKYINRYSTDKIISQYKPEYHIYLKAVEYSIYELNRMVEVYHHQFLAKVMDDFHVDLLHSPKFSFAKENFKKCGIIISDIAEYSKVIELKGVCNDLKHAYIQEYSLSKTLNLKSSKHFDRKMLVDRVNVYFNEIPKYIESLAKKINEKYPKIEERTDY